MISTILATMAMGQSPKLSFTMILVAGNEHPIFDLKDVEQPSTDKMTLAIQKLTQKFDRQKHSYMLLDGANIAEPVPSNIEPPVFVLGKSFSHGRKVEEDVIQDGKKVHMSGFQSASQSTNTTKLFVYRQDRVNAAGFSNTMMGEKAQSLFLSPLASLLLVNKEDRPEYQDYYPNQIAVSRTSVDETRDWLKVNVKKYKPSLVLCASGRPQDGRRDLLAFPPEGVILTYQVTFDKRWSAELKDIIRVQ